jgi:predicted DNA-binding transcriptional regulator AlpA
MSRILVSPNNIDEIIEVGRSESYELLKKDPTFPKLRKVSGRRVAWLVEDLAAWARNLPIHETGLNAGSAIKSSMRKRVETRPNSSSTIKSNKLQQGETGPNPSTAVKSSMRKGGEE